MADLTSSSLSFLMQVVRWSTLAQQAVYYCHHLSLVYSLLDFVSLSVLFFMFFYKKIYIKLKIKINIYVLLIKLVSLSLFLLTCS